MMIDVVASCDIESTPGPRQCSWSVNGLVSLLTDSDCHVQAAALTGLLQCIDGNWHEIADGLAVIEGLAENESFSHRKAAALLAAKLLYNLEMGDAALVHAMAAEDLFDIKDVSEFTQTIIAKAVERYCTDRQSQFESAALSDTQNNLIGIVNFPSSSHTPLVAGTGLMIDTRLETLVERMINESRLHRGKQGEIEALGVALESRRLDKLKIILSESRHVSDLCKYCIEQSQTTITSQRFRSLLLELIVEIYHNRFPTVYSEGFEDEFSSFAYALFLSGKSSALGDMLHHLLLPSNDLDMTTHNYELGTLMGYQIAFDLVSYDNQQFLVQLLDHALLQLPVELEKNEHVSGALMSQPVVSGSQALSPLKDTDREEQGGILQSYHTVTEEMSQQDIDSEIIRPLLADHKNEVDNTISTKLDELHVIAESNITSTQEELTQPNVTHHPITEELDTVQSSSSSSSKLINEIQEQPTQAYKKINTLRNILSGVTLLKLTVDFLHRENRSDLILLDQIKSSVDPRSSITQNAIVICHALMQAGTTCDVFVRENLDWFGRAICWAKFTAAAANGVLHKGHIQASKQVLSAYLPGSGGGSFSEGGALMALGLIHTNRFDSETRQYLLEQLQGAQTYCPQNYEPLQHGACFGLGLLAMGANDSDIYSSLREILFTDSALSGEAAAISMGLVALGSGSTDVAFELLGHAHDTEHERSVRGASLGAAFVMYRKEEEADAILEQMGRDKDPMIRYGGMFAIGMAYCGTSNRTALRRLLHIGVSDVSNDVRRAAVIALGFVMCNSPNQIPRIVALLADSFNPHVRYAAALAVGVGCSGTESIAAVDLLLPMTQDTTDFVRQGALLALGLVLAQASTASLPDGKVQKVRDLIVRIAADKHEDSITRFGAIISQGLIDAGGRNATISFFSSTKALRPESAVGFALFCQLWFWYPLILSVSLAFRPTAFIGLTNEMEPAWDFEVSCTGPAAKFAYVESIKKHKKEEKKEAISAVLSTTQKRKQQEQIKKFAAGQASIEATIGKDEHMHESLEAFTDKNGNGTVVLNEFQHDTQHNSIEKDKELDVTKSFTHTTMIMQNPCRIVPNQEMYITIDLPTNKWQPIDPKRRSGVVLLQRRQLLSLEDVPSSTDIIMEPVSNKLTADPMDTLPE